MCYCKGIIKPSSPVLLKASEEVVHLENPASNSEPCSLLFGPLGSANSSSESSSIRTVSKTDGPSSSRRKTSSIRCPGDLRPALFWDDLLLFELTVSKELNLFSGWPSGRVLEEFIRPSEKPEEEFRGNYSCRRSNLTPNLHFG